MNFNIIYNNYHYIHFQERSSAVLQEALDSDDLDLVEQTLAHVELNKPLPNGELPLHFAVRKNKEAAVASLLDRGASSEIRDFQGLNAIDHAVLLKQENILALILEKKFGGEAEKLEAQIKNKDTGKYAEDLKFKLINKTKIDLSKLTPLCKAAFLGYLEEAELHLQTINERDENGLLPIHYAILGKRENMIEALCDWGADVNAPTNDGETLLHYAVISGSKEIVKAILEAGFDPNEQNLSGETPLHYAAAQDKLTLIDLIQENGGNPSIVNPHGISPLALIGSSAYQKDPLSISNSHLILFATTALSWLLKMAAEGGWMRSENAKFAIMAIGFATGLAKSWNSVDPAWEIIAKHTCDYGLRQIPGLKFYYSALKSYDIAWATFKGVKNFWNNLGYRTHWSTAKHITVHGVNAFETAQKFQKNAQSTYEIATELLSLR